MRPKLYSLAGNAAALRLVVAAAVLALGGAAGCKNEVEVGPDPGTAYFPVAVGNSWTYAVVDTVWSEATGTQLPLVVRSVPTVTSFKVRETVTETTTDASGKPAYRLVHATMAPNSTVWTDDSVFVLTANPQYVALNRNNVRTVELVFPVREGGTWNLNAFNNSARLTSNVRDSVTSQTRQYSRVGQPYATGGGAAGLPTKSYATTVTTDEIGNVTENTLIKRIGYQQVFAKGVGPVFKKRFFFAYFYVQDPKGLTFVDKSYGKASTRDETLIDYVVK
jgi:hypothetical protein